jgi:hypothetical protein
MKCLVCEDSGWVCENHRDQPWGDRTHALAAVPVHPVLAATLPPPISRHASRKVSRPMASSDGWRKRFDNPVVPPDGKKLVTLRDAIQHLSETVPKREHDHPAVLLAATTLTNAAEGRDFMMRADRGDEGAAQT